MVDLAHNWCVENLEKIEGRNKSKIAIFEFIVKLWGIRIY